MKNKKTEKILPGALFKTKTSFAGMLSGEIFMYVGTEKTEYFLKHKFLNKEGGILCWSWKDDIQDFMKINGNHIERIET